MNGSFMKSYTIFNQTYNSKCLFPLQIKLFSKVHNFCGITISFWLFLILGTLNNLSFLGEKFWIIIPPDQKEEFEKAVNKYLSGQFRDECLYKLRQKDLFFNPSFLNEHNINYHTVVTQPGDLLFIGSGVYHSGGCLSNPCINMAANVAGPSWVEEAYKNMVDAGEPHSGWFEFEKCRCSQQCKDLLKFRFSKQFISKLNK